MEDLKQVPADQRHDYLTGISRSELQRTAKEAGLKANMKSALLIANLLEALGSQGGGKEELNLYASETLTAVSSATERLEAAEQLAIEAAGAPDSEEPQESLLPPESLGQDGQASPQPPEATVTDEPNEPAASYPSSELLLSPSCFSEAPRRGRGDVFCSGQLEDVADEPSQAPVKDDPGMIPRVSSGPDETGMTAAEGAPDLPNPGACEIGFVMSQTLPNAVADLLATRSSPAGDLLGNSLERMGSTIDAISISPFLARHAGCPQAALPQDSAMAGSSGAAEALDAAIAAADTAILGMNEWGTPGMAAASSAGQNRADDSTWQPGSAALPGNPGMDNLGTSELKDKSLAGGVTSRTRRNVMVSPFASLPTEGPREPVASQGPTGSDETMRGAGLPGLCGLPQAPPIAHGPGHEMVRSASVSRHVAKDLHSFSRGRESGLWEGAKRSELDNLQKEWNELKQSKTARNWSIPTIADVQAKSTQLAASGFTTVDSPVMRPSSRLLISQGDDQSHKRKAEALGGNADLAPPLKKQTVVPPTNKISGPTHTPSRLARRPLAAADHQSNIRAPGGTPNRKEHAVAKGSMGAGHGHSTAGSRFAGRMGGAPAGSSVLDRNRKATAAGTTRSGIPAVRPGK